jgi:hypothetical protein
MDDQRGGSIETRETVLMAESPHQKHCFIVMPFGRDAEEERWFRGWYHTVIQPVVSSCGFDAILSAAEDQPGAINDEIRAHLVFDPMVIVDLGGRLAEDPPNPNVMYELGIRHAFGLPLVIMGWEGQKLPFDVSNQRAITTRRDFMDIEPTRQKLSRFIHAAREGRYYNPMESVGREAAIDAASEALGEESLLAALAKEVRELRTTLISRRESSEKRWLRRNLRIKPLLDKVTKAALWVVAQDLGLDGSQWGKFLGAVIDPDLHGEMRGWSLDQWKRYLEQMAPKLLEEERLRQALKVKQEDERARAEEQMLSAVAAMLPPKPWPEEIHKKIAEKFEISNTRASDLIHKLSERSTSPQTENLPGAQPNSANDPREAR